jgi:uncharacterized membrane protein YqjE
LTTIQQLLSLVQHTSLSTAIRRSDWAVMALEAVHLLGLALLGGAACILALAAVRRAGLRGMSVATLAHGLRAMFGAGLLLMTVSGVLIVLSMPFKYYLNTAFRLKMLLLVVAIAATAWLLRMSRGAAPTGRQRGLALLSALLWLGVGFSGRLIGFL